MITPEKLLESAKELETQLRTWRRTLHRHPEVGFDLPETKALVKKALTEMGYTPQDCGKCGVLALAGGKRPGKTILLRGDMDALPIQEESGEEFASEIPGRMHGCGHDMHTAMMLGAAKLLKAHQSELKGTVKLVFQPDEEGFTASGALRMGVNEMTRFGFGKEQFAQLAHLIADCVIRNADVREEAARLRENFTDMRYCFSDAETESLISALAKATGI